MERLYFDREADIPLHENAVAGRLENGLHYFILPHG